MHTIFIPWTVSDLCIAELSHLYLKLGTIPEVGRSWLPYLHLRLLFLHDRLLNSLQDRGLVERVRRHLVVGLLIILDRLFKILYFLLFVEYVETFCVFLNGSLDQITHKIAFCLFIEFGTT